MSCIVPLSTIQNKKYKYLLSYDDGSILKTIRIVDTVAYVPFNDGLSLNEFSLKKVNPIFKFIGNLNLDQEYVKNKTLSLLDKYKSVILSCYTGFGKTITSLNVACLKGSKILIVLNKKVLFDQWSQAIYDFCGKHCTILDSKTNISIDEGFYLINVINISKKPMYLLNSFDMVIIDEVHLIFSKKNFVNLLYLTPNYLLGLSATPYRNDNLNKLFELFFGKNNLISKPLFKTHIVNIIQTNFKPTITYTKDLRINWNAILNEQAENIERNNLIVDIITKFKDRVFLVLVKRISQGEWLAKKLSEKREHVSTLFGKDKLFDKNCRILIGTNLKIGTGFDFTRLNTLLLAADVVDYYLQFLGRVMRTPIEPVIFDFLDNNSILLKHFYKRNAIYKKHGGIVQKLTTF
ncbi:hypothetical protein AGMMS49579_03790 [Spirochaetia bacterium]|nr:hypothetical protein AGMMS49579_03790 [Spirochaetia bacterium]